MQPSPLLELHRRCQWNFKKSKIKKKFQLKNRFLKKKIDFLKKKFGLAVCTGFSLHIYIYMSEEL